MKAFIWAVGGRVLSRKSRRRLEDLVGAAQLADFTLQFGDPLGLIGAGPGPLTIVDLGLFDPVAQRFPPRCSAAGQRG
ncbi:hypothetical protein AB0B56_27690 [Streptosporangium canum]